MFRSHLRRIVIPALVVLVVSSIGAEPVELESYRDRQPVMIVYTRSRDDVRPFSFNLDLSTNWNNVVARDIAIVDIDPLSHDVDAVAEQLGLGDLRFAVVLIGRDGTVLTVTEDETSLRELLRTLDLHSSGSDEQP